MFQVHAVPIGPTTDPQFRTCCLAVPTTLLGSGWVQGGDSGQINPATVALPAASSYAGYMILRSDDGTPTKPEITVKIWFGRWSTRFIYVFEFGLNGTDGNGNLIAPSSLFTNASIVSTYVSPATQDIAIGAGRDWFSIGMGSGHASDSGAMHVWGMERLIGEASGSEFENAIYAHKSSFSHFNKTVVTKRNKYEYIQDGTGTHLEESAIQLLNNPDAGNVGIGFHLPTSYRSHKPALGVIGLPSIGYNAGDEQVVNRYGNPIPYYVIYKGWGHYFPLSYSGSEGITAIRKS